MQIAFLIAWTSSSLGSSWGTQMQVQSLGQEDPLEKEMSTCSSILAWKMLWTEEAGGLQFMGLQGVGLDWARMHGYLPFPNMGSGILSSQCLPQSLAPSKQLKKCLLIMCMNEWWVKEMWSNEVLWPAQERINYSVAELTLESRLPEYDTTFGVVSFLWSLLSTFQIFNSLKAGIVYRSI